MVINGVGLPGGVKVMTLLECHGSHGMGIELPWVNTGKLLIIMAIIKNDSGMKLRLRWPI